jgi:uncharacterized Zn finger protein
MTNHSDFFYPRYRYYGKLEPKNLVFNGNLQEFSQRVNYICNLETNGKLSPEAAYEEISELWQHLKQSKKQLGLSKPSQGENGKSDA